MARITNKQKLFTMSTLNIILLITATATALSAGIFYTFTCSVNSGLRKLPDREYLSAMQSINKEILNPLFFMNFLGALLLLPISSWLHYRDGDSSRFVLLLIATLVYVTGVFGVTILGNVPLNNVLAGINLSASTVEEISKLRIHFEVPWNRLHTIRTISSTISLVLVLMACLNSSHLVISGK